VVLGLWPCAVQQCNSCTNVFDTSAVPLCFLLSVAGLTRVCMGWLVWHLRLMWQQYWVAVCKQVRSL
jgi:hypothetical protein